MSQIPNGGRAVRDSVLPITNLNKIWKKNNSYLLDYLQLGSTKKSQFERNILKTYKIVRLKLLTLGTQKV